jgi:MSHA biogenesis protein MshJ
VLGGLWEAVLAAPLAARERLAAEQAAGLQQRLEQINQSITVAAEGIGEGMPNQLDRLNALRARVAEGEQALSALTRELVDPKQMRAVLEELIRRQAQLELVSATNLEVRPLVEDDDDEGEADEGAEPQAASPSSTVGSSAPQLYRHTLVLRVRGSYLDCLEYLKAVERLPWRLYWGRLEVAAGEYPQNDIVIELHTLSLDKEWIGV